jgi:hypothetical protein
MAISHAAQLNCQTQGGNQRRSAHYPARPRTCCAILLAPADSRAAQNMFERTREFLTRGTGRPLGTMWMMEKAYFVYRRKMPGMKDQIYLRLALQSRYRRMPSEDVTRHVSECPSLDALIMRAVGIDFNPAVAMHFALEVLWLMPPCSRCHKYRALSSVDSLCYGCRHYAGFGACPSCHLYWDGDAISCQRCGSTLWRITDGPGVEFIPLANSR